MPRIRIPRPSPAMVVAIVALIAVGASSATAASLVTSKQIKNGTIQLGDLSRKARAKLRAGLCTPRSQTCVGARGPQGVAGSPGAAGAAGATNVVMRQGATVTIAASAFAAAEASCLPGERATGGGVYNESQVFTANVTSSYPTPNPTTPPATGNGKTPTGWRAWVANNSTNPVTVNGYVICAAP